MFIVHKVDKIIHHNTLDRYIMFKLVGGSKASSTYLSLIIDHNEQLMDIEL